MKFGVCCTPAEARDVLAAGFDYIEIGASGFNGLEETWDAALYEGLPILATNLFFDTRIKLFGREATPYREYVERTLERAASLRIPVMVIGSGASRKAPDGFEGDRAFADIVAEIADEASVYGITIAPESLNRTETNVGNDLRRLAIALQNRSGYTADSYHVLFEWDAKGRCESLEDLWRGQIPYAPAHVHIADLPRFMPMRDDPMLQGFPRRLQEVGFSGNVSLECRRDESFDLHRALEELKALFGQ